MQSSLKSSLTHSLTHAQHGQKKIIPQPEVGKKIIAQKNCPAFQMIPIPDGSVGDYRRWNEKTQI